MKKPNILDRAIMTMAPVHAAKRVAARVALSVIKSGYGSYGANLTKKSMRGGMYHGGAPRRTSRTTSTFCGAEPRRLHGHPNGNGGAENHADERGGGWIDACAAQP